MRIACRVRKATNTHSQYVILIAIPLQQWLHGHTLPYRTLLYRTLHYLKLPYLTLPYTHIACFVLTALSHFPVITITPLFHTHSLINHRRFTNLTNDS
jgi:hypothetical protein